MSNLAEQLLDANIRQRRFLVGVENKVVRDVAARFRMLELELVAKVIDYLGSKDPDTWLTAARQARILGQFQRSLTEIYPGLERTIERTISEVAEAEADMLLGRLAQAAAQLPEPIPIFKVPAKMVEEVVTNFLPKDPSAGMLPVAERIKQLKPRTLARLKRAFTDSVARGDGAAQIAASVRRVIGKKSISVHEAATLARTQVQRVANDVARSFYYRNRAIAPRVQVVVTLDKRTCLQCGPLDGKIYANGQAPVFPLHPQCRCFVTPVVASWRQLGIPRDRATPAVRRLFDGKPAPRTSYKTWFGRQSADVQKDILGRTRYEAFKAGADPGDFATDRRILTVKEYKEKVA